MQKLKYEFDPHNRLTVKSSSLLGVRKVLDGQFKISEHNNLAYHIKAPIPGDIKAPHQLKLKGNWSLTKDHQLCLTLDKWRRRTFGDQLKLQGEIIDVQKNSLLFAVTTRTKDDMPSTYILELSGSWQADEHNRLTFSVDKERGSADSLTFAGAWQINENYQIIYRYEQAQMLRKAKKIHTLIFKGYWDIKERARLSYIIDCDSGSGFDFKTSAGIFKDNYIKYELGVGLSRKKQPIKRVITFFGKWQVKKNIGLVFEVQQEEKRIQAIVFGAEARFTDKGTVSFKLTDNLNRAIGGEVELSQNIFDGYGQAFLRLLKSKQESAILAGSGWRW